MKKRRSPESHGHMETNSRRPGRTLRSGGFCRAFAPLKGSNRPVDGSKWARGGRRGTFPSPSGGGWLSAAKTGEGDAFRSVRCSGYGRRSLGRHLIRRFAPPSPQGEGFVCAALGAWPSLWRLALLHHINPICFKGQTRMNRRPTTMSFATQPTAVLRESMLVERWSPIRKHRFSGT